MRVYPALSAVLLFATLNVAVPAIAAAQEIKAAVSVRDVLLNSVGKRVALRVGGDQDIEGTVSSVGVDTVMITKLTGKDFYDSVIVIIDISLIHDNR